MIKNRLNARHVLVLELLQNDKKTSSQLASEHLSTASITMTVARLEQKKLVSRKRDKQDKRKVFISITAAGRKLLKN